MPYPILFQHRLSRCLGEREGSGEAMARTGDA